jgi:hypothetical protein
MDWRKHMARDYVAGTLRELAGLPAQLPASGSNGGSASFPIYSDHP